MSYWTNRDFVEPIREGNNRLANGELFYVVHENRGYYEKVPANLGGLIAVIDSYDFSFNEEQKKIFIEQVKEISLEKATDVFGILDIAEHNHLLEEVQALLLKKLEVSPVERADEWYMSVYRINRSLQHLKMHACGGAVNGSWWLTPKEDEEGEGEGLIGGYYNFRDGHLSGTGDAKEHGTVRKASAAGAEANTPAREPSEGKRRSKKMLGWILVVSLAILAAIVVTGIIVYLATKRNPAVAVRDDTENVVDLNDRFNRARYMSEDGN